VTCTNVYPSGGDDATLPMPIVPPAPGRFSTMTGWPRMSFAMSAMNRAVRSLLPPGL